LPPKTREICLISYSTFKKDPKLLEPRAADAGHLVKYWLRPLRPLSPGNGGVELELGSECLNDRDDSGLKRRFGRHPEIKLLIVKFERLFSS